MAEINVNGVEGIGKKIRAYMYEHRNFTNNYCLEDRTQVFEINGGKVRIDLEKDSVVIEGGEKREVKGLLKIVGRNYNGR